jgi:hypothetical protein
MACYKCGVRKASGLLAGMILAATTLTGLSAADAALAANARAAAFGSAALGRAESWYREDLVYSQDRCYGNGIGYSDADWSGAILGGCRLPSYRTDCSGFVSMAWDLPFSYATPRPGATLDLGDVTREIPRDELLPGDALVASGQHVRLFERWTDAARTRYLAYDFGSTPVRHQEFRWEAAGDYHYMPVRYAGSR